MSAPSFTPGPWQRSGVRVRLGEHDCLAVGPDGFSIAFLPIGRRPDEQAGAIADAKLTAAAPDLFEAAENAVGCFDAAEFEGLSQVLAETTDERLKDLVERRLLYATAPLLDAIAKARGDA